MERRFVQRSDYQNTGGEGGGDTCQVCCPSNMATLARDMVRKASKETQWSGQLNWEEFVALD